MFSDGCPIFPVTLLLRGYSRMAGQQQKSASVQRAILATIYKIVILDKEELGLRSGGPFARAFWRPPRAARVQWGTSLKTGQRGRTKGRYQELKSNQSNRQTTGRMPTRLNLPTRESRA
jgi:hypothetical protein